MILSHAWEGKKMKYAFTPEFYTGIEAIDKEHARLFEITNNAYDLLTNDFIPDKYDQISAILEELREYTKTHFAHEEAYMESISYQKIWSQKIQHAGFIKKLDSYDLKKIDDTQRDSLLEILDFLAKWLFGHIKGMDCKIPKN